MEMLLKGTDFLKSAFTVALRSAFTIQTMFPAYKYDNDDTISLLSIYPSFPKRPLKGPTIIVSVGPMDLRRNTLSDSDLLKETYNESGDVDGFFAWGKVDTTVKINIATRKDSDRRKLTDITAIFCRHLFTYQLAKFGIGFTSVKATGENEMDWQGQLLYMNTIDIPCYTEFQVKYPADLVIADINIPTNIDSEL